MYVAYYLDSCIFESDYSAMIQSYTGAEGKKLVQKLNIMWDNFPQNIKDLIGIRKIMDNTSQIKFSNGSTIEVGNARGTTLQGLHVSELGKIAREFPKKAEELQTGAFQAVAKNNKITIESTAEGGSGLFFDMWEKAVSRLDITNGDLSPLDYHPIFLSWIEDPDCELDYKYPISSELKLYFDELEERLSIKIPTIKKQWYANTHDNMKDRGRMHQEYPSYPEEAFKSSIGGTFYKSEYKNIIKEKRIQPVEYNPNYKVDVGFDLGMADRTSLTFAQVIKGQLYVIDEYSNTGEGIEHYVDVMNKLGYNYGKIFLPHDAKVRELSTGRSRFEAFRKFGVNNAVIVKRLGFEDSINGLRDILKTVIIGDNCGDTIQAIQLYKRKFDKKTQTYLPGDFHDHNSDIIAGFRYLALGISDNYILSTNPRHIEKRNRTNFNRKRAISGSFAI